MPTLNSETNSENLTLDTAQTLLRQFICVNDNDTDRTADRPLVQQAVLLVAQHSDYQIFGICADTVIQATTALHTYLKALGYSDRPDVPTEDGALYVKFNPAKGKLHTEPYTGVHRGVLVSCQSAYDGDVNETFGHLPLDLFE